MKLKKGDNVIVMAGKDKGKKGVVFKSMPRIGKVVIEGVNLTKKHRRPRREGEQGTVLDVAMPISVSNVQIVDPKTGKASRVGKKEVKGTKVRISRKSGQEI